jgi:23S rRNA (uracil1939-C5)-methyltransferase
MTAPGRPAGERILDMADLGARGDGIARPDGERGGVFVPFALPGEQVRAAVDGNRGRLVEILRAAPERIDPVCPHFTRCGGCAVQHLAGEPYRDWKRGLVVAALAHRGIDAAADPLVDAHGAGRRRATLHVTFDKGVARAGYMAPRSHALVDLDACPILAPGLAAAPAIARALAAPFAKRGKPLDIRLTATQTGIDADIGRAGALALDTRLDLPEIAERLDLARITAGGDLVLERRIPTIAAGSATIALPPGAFLQATAAGETALAALVEDHVGAAASIADLFCGIGPFALRLARTAAILAADSDAAAIAALDAAARHAQGLKPVRAVRRDLFRDPLVASQLREFAAVVFDPPRAGAEAQARELALSAVPVIVAVSCDPASFARDAEILIAGGYRLDRVTPVDQFRYSPHVELVARFERPA